MEMALLSKGNDQFQQSIYCHKTNIPQVWQVITDFGFQEKALTRL